MSVSFSDAFKVWAKIGLLSFGGPAGQIALLHREIVDDRKWLSEKEFLSALNFCMLLPGPEALQLAIYAGWKLHGIRGGLAAGLLFFVQGAFVILALSMLYASFGRLPIVEALFYGIKAAVLAIVIEALLRVAKRALKGQADWWIAAFAFIALFCFGVPFPIVIIAAGLFGFQRSSGVKEEYTGELPTLNSLAKTAGIWIAIWLVPLAAIVAAFGHDHIFAEIGIFFSKLAVVTFGGAYAVLSYMAQAAVEDKNWLLPSQMIDGLGLAETTPGPLILVNEFVGYLAAYGKYKAVWAGIVGAFITLWMTFAPCFLYIFVGAPYIEAIGKRPRLTGTLQAITAAVVGVIFNLSVWFGLHVLFGNVERLNMPWFRPWVPDWTNLDVFALCLSLFTAVALLRFHIGMIKTLGLSAIMGLLWWLFRHDFGIF